MKPPPRHADTFSALREHADARLAAGPIDLTETSLRYGEPGARPSRACAAVTLEQIRIVRCLIRAGLSLVGATWIGLGFLPDGMMHQGRPQKHDAGVIAKTSSNRAGRRTA